MRYLSHKNLHNIKLLRACSHFPNSPQNHDKAPCPGSGQASARPDRAGRARPGALVPGSGGKIHIKLVEIQADVHQLGGTVLTALIIEQILGLGDLVLLRKWIQILADLITGTRFQSPQSQTVQLLMCPNQLSKVHDNHGIAILRDKLPGDLIAITLIRRH